MTVILKSAHTTERLRNKWRRYYRRHREQIIERKKAYYAANKEHLLRKQKETRAAFPDGIAAYRVAQSMAIEKGLM